MQVIVDRNGEDLIEEIEVESGLFIPNTVVKASNHKAKVLVVNTTNQEITIPQIRCKLSDYIVSKMETQNIDVGNYLKLDQLQDLEKKLITEICNEYRDIFFLPGDKLTATKTLTHEIPLQANTPPIHVKPYRILQSRSRQTNARQRYTTKA